MAVQGPYTISILNIFSMVSGGSIGTVLRLDVFIVAVSPGSKDGSRGSDEIVKFFLPNRCKCALSLSGFKNPMDFNRLFVDIDTCFDCEEFGLYTGSTVGGDNIVGVVVASDGDTC